MTPLFVMTFPFLENSCILHGAPWMLWSSWLSTIRHYENSSSRSTWECNSSSQLLLEGAFLKLEGKLDSDERMKMVQVPGPICWWKLRPQTVIDLEETMVTEGLI